MSLVERPPLLIQRIISFKLNLSYKFPRCFFTLLWCYFPLLCLHSFILFLYISSFRIFLILHSSLPSSLRAASPPSDQAYVQAAAIFQQLRPEKTVAPQLLHYRSKTDEPLAESRDRATQRQACQLAFNTLKCMKFNHVVFSNCGNFCII